MDAPEGAPRGRKGLLRCARSSRVAANEHTAKYFPRRKARSTPPRFDQLSGRFVTVSEPPRHLIPFDADTQLKEAGLGRPLSELSQWVVRQLVAGKSPSAVVFKARSCTIAHFASS